MEFKETNCISCNTNKSPIFARQPMRHNKDYYCQKCIDKGLHLDK